MTAEIAFVIADLGPGGAQRVITLLANEWSDRGISVAVITLQNPGDDHFSLPIVVSRLTIDGNGESRNILQAILANLRRVVRLRQTIRKTNARTVVTFVGVTNILGVLASVGAPWRLIISERNDPARQSLGRIWDWLRMRLYRYADVVTANSVGALKTLGEYVPKKKLSLVLNPIDPIYMKLDATPREPFILAVGRLVEQKAFDVLILAFAEFREAFPNWKLKIAGEGPLKHTLEELADSVGIGNHIEWLGAVEDCSLLYRRASFFVLPSRFEGTPNALLEAMASGCTPIVSDASPGPLDYVTQQKNGLVVGVNDVSALEVAMSKLAGDHLLCKELGCSASRRVSENSLQKVVDEWTRIIDLQSYPT